MMILTESEFKQSRIYQEIKQECKLEIVPRLIERGFSVEEIAEILGLEVEQMRQAVPQ